MINLKENELDTLAGFLGHNIKVHRDFYRLPEDTLQVAKISKILLEMERGQIHLYKGKTLDEIQLDPEAEELIQDDDDDDNDAIEARKTSEMDESGVVTMAENALETEQSNKSGIEGHVMTSSRTRTKRTTNRKPWSEEEKSAVRRQLGKFFSIYKLPGKHDIEVAIKKEPVISNRPWAQIKFFIKNTKYSESRYKIKDLFSK